MPSTDAPANPIANDGSQGAPPSPTGTGLGAAPASLNPLASAYLPPGSPFGGYGMAVPQATNTTPGGTVRVQSTVGGTIPSVDLAALKSIIDESVHKAITGATAPLHEEIGALRERANRAETAVDEFAKRVEESESDGGSESAVSTIASLIADEDFYLRVDAKQNQHFGAADLANNGQFKPHRHDLYGHAPWMVLTKGGNDTGGVLGFALSYAEPLALYGKTSYEGCTDILERAIAMESDDDFQKVIESLVALRNNLREHYRMCNLFRTIIAQRARALRPGASEYDKAEVKYIERVLNERDYATADTADAIARLKNQFSRRSNKAHLEHLSKKTGGGGSGGGGGANVDSDDDSDDGGSSRKSRNKKKRDKAKAKKRAARESESAGSGGERAGKDRDKSSRRTGGERTQSRDSSGSRDGGGKSKDRSKSAPKPGKRDKSRAEAAEHADDDGYADADFE